MKLTLLGLVQRYMDRTSGFPITSIMDLDEAMQVASVAEDVFYEFLQLYPDLVVTQKDRTLDATGDSTKPNFLSIPDEINRIQESTLYYNVADGIRDTVSYREIWYVTPLEFMQRTMAWSDRPYDADVITGYDGVKMVVPNDCHPTYFTSFDDKYVVFDSYDKEIDSTLQASKSRVLSNELPTWVMSDGFVIPIPDHLTSTYLNMFLDQAYNDVRQERNAMISQKARRDRIKLQQDSRKVGSSSRARKAYGRCGSNYGYGAYGRGYNGRYY